jgi:hypothetical protein
LFIEKKPAGDVNSCGKKWKIGSSSARSRSTELPLSNQRTVLDDAQPRGERTADGVDAIAAILCDGKVAAQAEPTPLSKKGDAKFAGKLAVPQNCASPMVVVRERYEAKSAAGLPAPDNNPTTASGKRKAAAPPTPSSVRPSPEAWPL